MVKYHALLFAASAVLAQQSTTYNYDVNGRPVAGATRSVQGSGDATSRAQTVRNVNGRDVPIESVEQRVVSDRNGVRVLERIVRRYDANGRPGPAEKVTIEERKNADGSVNTTTTVMREDINGHMALAERSSSESRKSGDTTTTTSLVERPTLNGSLELVEKREATKRESATAVSENSTLYRRDANGRFGEAAREVKDVKIEGDRRQENTAIYEASPNGGAMTLLRQIVANSMKSGNKVDTEMNIYELETAGKAASPSDTKPKLREQRLIESSATGNGTTESVSVRRPSPNDPGRLGPPQKVEETVCTGCKP